VMMLVHLGQLEVASKVQNAWLKTLEDGVHTKDIFREGVSKQLVGTKAFAEAVIARLGQKPSILKPVEFHPTTKATSKTIAPFTAERKVVGLDVFIYENNRDPNVLGKKLEAIQSDGMKLISLANRGIKVYPKVSENVYCSDLWRAQYMAPEGQEVTLEQIVKLMGQLAAAKVEFVQTQHLCTFGGKKAFAASQGD